MRANGYLDRSVQKAFLNKASGCIEHHAKLTILRNARSKHTSLVVCWLDLANTYGSVHHSLINFSLQGFIYWGEEGGGGAPGGARGARAGGGGGGGKGGGEEGRRGEAS